jgi:hypothetical protein
MSRKLVLLFSLITAIYFLLASTRSLSIIWPLDCPADFPGDSSQQHKISGLLGEYRPKSGSTPIHFHGGIDMPAQSATPVYSVLTGVVVDTNSVYERIAIRNEWDPYKYVWDDFRYLKKMSSLGGSLVFTFPQRYEIFQEID